MSPRIGHALIAAALALAVVGLLWLFVRIYFAGIDGTVLQ